MAKKIILITGIVFGILTYGLSFAARKPLQAGLTLPEIIVGLESIVWITGGTPPYSVTSFNPSVVEVKFDKNDRYYIAHGKMEGITEIIVKDRKGATARVNILVIKPPPQKTPQQVPQTQQLPKLKE